MHRSPHQLSFWRFGEEVNRSNLQRIRRRVGLVFQDPDDQLFMPTVIEDVAFGPINIGCTQEEAFVRSKARSKAKRRQMSAECKKNDSIAHCLDLTPLR